MADIGLNLYNKAEVIVRWSRENPNIVGTLINCDLPPCKVGGEPIPYARDRVNLHGTPDDIRAFAEKIIGALPPACMKCGTSILTGNSQLCDGCEAEEQLEAERNSRPQTLADVGMCEADFL